MFKWVILVGTYVVAYIFQFSTYIGSLRFNILVPTFIITSICLSVGKNEWAFSIIYPYVFTTFIFPFQFYYLRRSKVTPFSICISFLNLANHSLFYIYFRLFKHTSLQFLQQINVKNVMSISIRCRDSNSRPLEHESPPITTGPGLPPFHSSFHRKNGRFALNGFSFVLLWSRISWFRRNVTSNEWKITRAENKMGRSTDKK